jgi:hypothetical protein
MIKYGINNVRGGSYTKIELDDWMIKSLEHEFASAKDNCYNCNEKGHVAKECTKTTLKLYLDEFKYINQINTEIHILEKVYGQISILNHQIKETNNFDVKKYKKYSDDNDKYNNINERYNILVSNERRSQTAADELKKLEYSKEMFSNSRNIYNDYNTRMDKIYRELFIIDMPFNNGIIKMSKLIIFNLEKKKELKDLLNIHTSEDLIKMKLEGLYEKKISILTN